MSNDLIPSEDSQPKAMGAGPQLLQKVGTLIVKAALNSVPLAGLALDLGQMGIDFANARVTERFFEQLGERIDRLEEDARERLKQDQVHQTTADAAIRRLLTETNPRMADALARAVAELGKPHRSAMERMEVARALSYLRNQTSISCRRSIGGAFHIQHSRKPRTS